MDRCGRSWLQLGFDGEFDPEFEFGRLWAMLNSHEQAGLCQILAASDGPFGTGQSKVDLGQSLFHTLAYGMMNPIVTDTIQLSVLSRNCKGLFNGE